MVVFIFLFIPLPSILGQAQSTVTRGLVLDGVTVVSTRDGTLMRDQAVVMDEGKIVKITRAHTIKTGGAAILVDDSGKYVIPGYLDMHVHPLDSNDLQGDLTLMLANGVTGIRVMSGSPELLARRKAGTLMPPTGAPELLFMPGTFLTTANSPTAAATVEQVRQQKAQGADFIKVVDMTPETLFAALGEAKIQGLTVDGHLPQTVDAAEAARRGMRGIEHLGPGVAVLLSCSTNEAALRQMIANLPARAAPLPGTPAGTGAGRAGDPVPAVAGPPPPNPQTIRMMQRIIDTYSEAKCTSLAKTFVQWGTWQTPTLIRLRTIELADDPIYTNDPNLRHIKPDKRQLWASAARNYAGHISPEARQTLLNFYELQLRTAKLFEDAGVKMLAGTDSGGSAPWCIAGFALGQEFDQLARAGFTPLQVLQLATLNGAEFLGRERTMGTVEVGKDANLVVLDANPIAAVANLKKISGVVRNGAYLPKATLQQMSDSVIYP